MSIKETLVFNPDKDDNYETWRDDVKMHQMYTKHVPMKQGPAAYLASKGPARDAITGTPRGNKAKEEVDMIINELNSVFRSDRATQAFLIFKDLLVFDVTVEKSFWNLQQYLNVCIRKTPDTYLFSRLRQQHSFHCMLPTSLQIWKG